MKTPSRMPLSGPTNRYSPASAGVSPISQVPLPQKPQSCGQVFRVSVASQVPLPQHWPQSRLQLWQLSVYGTITRA